MSDFSKPNTKEEVYMAAASGNLGSDAPLPEPRTRTHEYLKAIAERIGEEPTDCVPSAAYSLRLQTVTETPLDSRKLTRHLPIM